MTILAFPFYPEEKDAKPSKVLVTGALGMIGGGCIQRLLACGHTVCGIDMDMSNDKAVLPLKALPHASDRLKLIQGDITDPNCVKNALKDCAVEYIIHTASPVMEPSDPSKAESELIQPAMKGACNVLEAANSCDSVQRVIMTSSTSAIFNEKKGHGAEFTEDDWAEDTSPEKGAYAHSKVLVEKKAWEMEKAQSRWKLVVINPVHCFGPQIDERMHSGWSVDIFVGLYQGKFEKEPNKDISVVDVRDVAAAHTLAMVHPHAHGRNIVSEGAYTARQLAEFLHEKCPDCKVPPASKDAPPKLTHFNNSKVQKELGLKFHSAKQALQDMYLRNKEIGCLPK